MPPRPPANADKSAWRAWARTARDLLATESRNQRVVEAIGAWPAFADARGVFAYLAFGSEIDLAILLAGHAGDVLVPRSHARPEPYLTLHPYDRSRLERPRTGPPQPAADVREVDARAVDLVLLPGLCFDRRGYRLGYGLGYYDRFIERLRPDVPLVAVTFDALVVDALPSEAHDVPATHLATESGVRAVEGA